MIAEDAAGVFVGLAVLAVILIVWYYIVICVILYCIVWYHIMVCACCEQIVWTLLVDYCRGWCWGDYWAGCAGRDSRCVVLHCDMCYLALCGITLWYVHVVNKLC